MLSRFRILIWKKIVEQRGLNKYLEMEENSTCNALVAHFKWQDYLVCGLMLLVSAAIGVYYAWKRKEASTNEILMGDRKMATFPMAMSLLAR